MAFIADTFGAEPADGVTVSTREIAPDDLKQRRGWFVLDCNLAREMSPDEWLALYDRFVPFHMVTQYDRFVTEVYGLHPDFEPIPDCEHAREYEAVFHQGANTGAYTVEWRPVEGEWRWIPQRREGE